MYEKQTWVTGDTITADRLNHMEDGISGGVLVVHVREDYNFGERTYTVDVPYADVVAALTAGTPVIYTMLSYEDGVLDTSSTFSVLASLKAGNVGFDNSPYLHTANGFIIDNDQQQ